MVVAVQQPLAECAALYAMCIVKHRPPPVQWQDKAFTDQQCDGCKTVPSSNLNSHSNTDTYMQKRLLSFIFLFEIWVHNKK